MPELPEVEAVARSLRPLVAGERIRRCRVVHSIAVRPDGPVRLRRSVEGQRIRGVERAGKWLLLRLDRGLVVMHFRLDGQLLWLPRHGGTGNAFLAQAMRDAGIGHLDVVFELGAGALGFVDRRHFGRVQWLARPEDLPGIRGLGIDPLSEEFTPANFEQLLRSSRRPLKLLLMDQSRIAGLGNIYSSEALWRARLDPRRRANRLRPAEARRVHKAVVDVLRRALQCCLAPPPDFRDPNWWFQGLEKMLAVYGREKLRCRRCSGRIRRVMQGGRSTFYCPSCQR